MNVSVAAASQADFDADRFSDTLGGKRAAYFRWRARTEVPSGPVETVGYYVATAHRGLVYSVTGVTKARLARRTQPLIQGAIESFRFLDTGVPGEAEAP